ncbi:hypothetical protein AB9F36_11660 [Rhizobium leguminosarum]|uniref:hypothetical protein n=1 Tax=Rhizobium leguminosarum TaxID=384 RepID=UPI003F9663A7
MQQFLNALPVVASSSTAYAAYVFTLLAWVVVAWRVRRYKILLDGIRSLPSRDRLPAIKAEMGSIDIKGGVSADQWLRSRIQSFYFAGFVVLCIVVLSLAAMTFLYSRGSVYGDIGLNG